MKTYEAYLFDWDGTIARSLEAWLVVVRQAFDQYGMHELTDDDLVSTFGDIEAQSLRLGIPQQKSKDFFELVRELSHAQVTAAPPYDGALDVLDDLRSKDKKLGLVTTDWRKSVDVKLENTNLTGIFDIVIAGDEVVAHKPSPEGILTALDKLSVGKEGAVMVGDSPHDIGAARNAGIDSILFYPPSHQLFYSLDDLRGHEPTYIVGDLRDLIESAAA
jgi:HAD superfamily hydrolase (TIGR01509 family)